MRHDPFGGDLVRLKHQRTAWRRRIVDWRILFDVHIEQGLVLIAAIRRRTTTTYQTLP